MTHTQATSAATPLKPLRVVFMGTPAFAVPTLQVLLVQHQVVAVLTQPDRPAGRGGKMQASPVKEAALAAGVEVIQPQTLFIKKNQPMDNSVPVSPEVTPEKASHASATGHEADVISPSPRDVRARLKTFDADIFVVAAYGLLLPKAVLEMPRLGCINVHGSLLPRYRGASPIHAAILNGDTTTGVTIMHMAEGMDTGDMILKREMPIAPDEHFPSVHDHMAILGAEALLEALDTLVNGTAASEAQDCTLATHAPIIKKTDGQIDWTQPAESILNKIRAYDPWPGAYTMLDGAQLKIWRAQAIKKENITVGDEIGDDTAPGTVLAADNNGLLIRAGQVTTLLATELQGQNAKKMPAGDFLRGRAIKPGTVLS
ncbi:MAG: methionyl-tRNA formyltransferase [Defluviitaleaceae bacterium]|nr:methionyl-tRNA formyltransferase [Defluviitaleaceae bacterium]